MVTQPVAAQAAAVQAFAPPSRGARLWHGSLRFARRQPLGTASAVVLVVLVVMAIFANVISPYAPTRNDVGPSLIGPTASHLFGTDNFGRDVFSRIVFGARISLFVGLSTTFVGTLGATIIGAVSGYRGGAFDYVVQRFVDAAQAIPALILLIGVMVVLGPSIRNVIIALAFLQALSLSRVIRGAVLGIRAEAYLDAARSVGARPARLLLQHILPNILPTIVVLVSTSIGGIIVAEASLSFLGFGVPPPNPSWGGMMSVEGRAYMLTAPWLLIFPTVALSLVVFAMNMFGDALRDEIDPRLRGSR